ncbi:23S rRNA (guanosine(2251)-2'-O)-methyltransferase RlmB [Helicobacter fennelliae]|uniref:23S rRNA (Guanosine-2'-O-)-methyltransferase rlmB n=2 Tax=Helicobacter fennelliae TaxID=215 RepID=T1DUM0_9HELI|nr:23S rRNA (guanosine(2251)-2'-O)-methyltransferase RlmB [Helicobacter fennelliae]GAD17777.1 23S rRNA (guanosine-2'-O-) -methyltransferase rlmB [Helicobacter fennelliae MRY12-0050]SQB98173.1 23S rRNA methyltransferase [Helicobacter fennelliae]STP07673.1 23S rRNA methyltransferase [Helicobacter fennelliae]
MIIYGKQVVLYAIKHCSEKIQQIYLAKEWDKHTFRQCANLNKPIIRLDPKKAQALAKGGNHQGILAEIAPILPCRFDELKQYSRILVLCGISDVGNLGAIFRSAYCLGVEGIIITQIQNPKLESIARTSSGAIFSLPFCIINNPLDVLNELKLAGFECYGADMRGENIAHLKPAQKWSLFLGNESEGLMTKISKKVDKILSIKMRNGFDSLNVSVAAGIVMAYLDSNT